MIANIIFTVWCSAPDSPASLVASVRAEEVPASLSSQWSVLLAH